MRKIMTGRKKITEAGREQLRLKTLGKNNPFYGKTHSDKYKQWLKDNKSGPNSNNYKGGTTPEHRLRINTAEWARIRLEAYKRDNYTCQRCNVKCTNNKIPSATTIQCHHLEPWRDTKNASLRKDNKSGYKGVSFYKSSKKWRAYIQSNKQLIHIGYFDTPEMAAKAYDMHARTLHGKYARLNFI